MGKQRKAIERTTNIKTAFIAMPTFNFNGQLLFRGLTSMISIICNTSDYK